MERKRLNGIVDWGIISSEDLYELAGMLGIKVKTLTTSAGEVCEAIDWFASNKHCMAQTEFRRIQVSPYYPPPPPEGTEPTEALSLRAELQRTKAQLLQAELHIERLRRTLADNESELRRAVVIAKDVIEQIDTRRRPAHDYAGLARSFGKVLAGGRV